jgi:HlyD family secretion protein
MFRKIFFWLSLALFAFLSVWLGMYFYQKGKSDPIIYKTEKPFRTDISRKTVATGSIVPRREVQIKPQASGVIEALFVEAGQQVRAGQLLARVKLVQSITGKNNDLMSMNSARNQVESAKIAMDNAKIELDRQKQLYDQKVISQQEYNRFVFDFNARKETYETANQNLKLVNQGVLQNSGAVANEIYATLDGTVLDVPIKVGSSVIERNNFNEGTTVAIIADMNSLVFEGKIDESEVGKLQPDTEMELNIGAIEGKKYKARLEYVSPKGVEKEGAIKFDIRAKLLLEAGDNLRAGYSASADILLEKKKNVLAIKESMLQFGKGEKGKDSVFVEIEGAKKQEFKKKLVKTGTSDGLNVEILSGVEEKDNIKLPPMKDRDKKEEKK